MQVQSQRVTIGEGAETREVAAVCRLGASPGLFWLGGYNSVMTGSKAESIDRLGAELGLAVTRFDYSGCGESGGDFADGTISRWLDEAEAVMADQTSGAQIVLGSSMGAWLALLLNRRLRGQGDERIKALVLVAPAVDMTHELMAPSFSELEQMTMVRDGRVERASAYSDEPMIITQKMIADGERHLLFGAPIETGCPVTILHGAQDPDVPVRQAIKLQSHLLQDEVVLTLIPDGDHRLSREEDLARIANAVKLAIAD